MSTENVKRN